MDLLWFSEVKSLQTRRPRGREQMNAAFKGRNNIDLQQTDFSRRQRVQLLQQAVELYAGGRYEETLKVVRILVDFVYGILGEDRPDYAAGLNNPVRLRTFRVIVCQAACYGGEAT